ncbi:MAG TPA: AMP-binding protein [Flavobacteriales bacterium]
MAAVFDRITIDGTTLTKGEVLRHFQKLDADPLTHNWAAPLHALVHTLITEPDAPLTAHTSGTTGDPKPIAIPRTDLIASARLTAQAFRLHKGDRALLCLPGEFIAGKMMLVRALVIGLDLHLIDPRGSILDHLNTTDRFLFTAMVPLQLHRAIQEDQARVEEQFEHILLGGGPTSDALIEDLQPLRTRVWQGYGSTETVTHVALRALNGPAREPHFTAIGDITFEQDERGCLIAHTPHLSVKKHITNDLVERIDERRFIWLGRADNVILSGGKKIFPEQLEARTAGVIPYAHYFTAYADDRLGQAVMLVLETEGPSDEVLPDVLKKVTEVLETHELPRRVTAVRRFQRTSGGKVQRGLTLKGIV